MQLIEVVKMISHKGLVWGCLLSLSVLFSCAKTEVSDEQIQIEAQNPQESVWTEDDLKPKEGEVTEDGQPVVMVFGAMVNYAQKKQQTNEGVNAQTQNEEEVDLGALEEQRALAESGDEEGSKSHLGALVEDVTPNYYPNLWSVGDRVSINGVSTASLPEVNITSEGKQARFPMTQWVEQYEGNWYVGYPADAFAFSSGTGTVTLPTKQKYVAGSYDPDAFIMVGKSDKQALNFCPQVAPFRITVPGASGTYYSKIRVESVDGEALSGAFRTNYNNEEATFEAIDGESYNYVEMDTPNLEFGTASKVFFVLPAQIYEHGIRIRVTRSSDGQEMVFSNTKKMTVAVGSMTALTSPTFTPTAAQGAPTLAEVTPSSFYVQWASGQPTKDYAKRWQILVYPDSDSECEGDPLRTIEIRPRVKTDTLHCWAEGQNPLRFIVGRMTPGAKYYVKVRDVGNDNLSATPANITLSSAPSTVEMPVSNVTSTGVVLREDFREIGWAASYYNGIEAGGFYPTTTKNGPSLDKRTFDYLDTNDSTTFIPNQNYYGFSYDRMNGAYEDSRMAKWLYSGYNYWMPGYIKMGTSANKGYLFTPAIPLAEGTKAAVRVTVRAAKYNGNTSANWALAVVSGVVDAWTAGRTTQGHFKRLADSYTFPDTDDVSLYRTMTFVSEDGLAWTERTFENLYMSNGDRLLFGLPDAASSSSGKARVNLGSVTVEVTELTDDFIIRDATSLEAFRGAVAAAADKSINARVVTDFDASALASWTPIDGYTGTLSGGDHTISGLTKPFFANLRGTVQNLTLNSTINQTADVDWTGIFAQRLNGTITDCISKGSVTFQPSTPVTGGDIRYVGGMVGLVKSGSMTRCTNYASVTVPHNDQTNSMNLEVGGVIGRLDNSTSAPISSYLHNVHDPDVTNSGKVSVSLVISTNTARNYRIGGVIGYVSSAASAISNCTNSGTVEHSAAGASCSLRVGGIVGHMRQAASGCQNTGEVTITSAASVEKGYLALGGVMGFWDVSSGSLSGCFNTGTVSNAGTVHKDDYSLHAGVGGLIGRATGATLTSTKTAYHYNNGPVSDSSDSDNVDIGGICGYTENVTDLTYCRNLSDGVVTVGTGSGSSSSAPYNVNISGILGLATGASTEVTLTSAINKGAINIYGATIGNDLCVGGVLAQNDGPFPAISGTSTDHTTNTGNITFTSNTLTGGLRVGGIWGWRANDNEGTVQYCTNSGSIVANSGGLAVSGTYTSQNYVGGIVGGGSNSTDVAPAMTVQYCYNTGGKNQRFYLNFVRRVLMGGIIGGVARAPKYCSNDANISLKRSIPDPSSWSAIGGIAGYQKSGTTGNRNFNGLSHNGTINAGETPYCYASGIVGYSNGDCKFDACSIAGSISAQQYNPGLFFSTPDVQPIVCKNGGCTVKSGTVVSFTDATPLSTTISSISDITQTNVVGGAGTDTVMPVANLSVVD